MICSSNTQTVNVFYSNNRKHASNKLKHFKNRNNGESTASARPVAAGSRGPAPSTRSLRPLLAVPQALQRTASPQGRVLGVAGPTFLQAPKTRCQPLQVRGQCHGVSPCGIMGSSSGRGRSTWHLN